MNLKLIISIAAMGLSLQSLAQTPGKIAATNQVLLPNGWKLSPAGSAIKLGDLPLNMQVSASGRLMAVTNNGQSTQSIQLIDPKNEKQLDEKIVGKLWYGLAFSHDEKKLYASGGNDNLITLDQAKRLSSAAACPLWVVPGAGHAECYGVARAEFLNRLTDIANNLEKPVVR